MRAALVLALVLAACSNPSAASPSPLATASPIATASPTPTSSPPPTATASPTPIVLPSTVQQSAPSGTVVWALVAGTRLFRSSDRGDTWVERTIPAGPQPNSEVAFADDTNGLLLSAGPPATQCQTQTATIWRTADGAASWQQLTATGVAGAMCKHFLASADASHAFFTTYSPNSGSLVYRSADGGATWAASTALPIPANLASHGAVFVSITGRPRAFGSVVLVDGGAGQTKDVFRSTDGGASFVYTSWVAAELNVAYATATRWLQIGPPSSSTETTDGGATWHPYTTDYSQAAPIAPDVVFGDASVGYATVRGAIQRTTDGGAHWTTIRTPGT